MTAIVNIGHGRFYPRLTRRLRTFCDGHGHPLEFADELPEGYPTHECEPYMAKVLWIARARCMHKRILWLDSSLLPVRPVNEFIKYVESHPFVQKYGVYAGRTGFSLGQSCNDRAFSISGLEADCLQQPEFASTILYIDSDKGVGKYVGYLMHCLAQLGAIKGSREGNSEESTRPEFLHHRQDQTCLTLAMYMASVDPAGSDALSDVAVYSCENKKPSADHYFVVAGGEGGMKYSLEP